MELNDLNTAINQTKAQIYELKNQINETSDSTEKRRLQRRLKELQYLQLWHIDKLG